MSFSHDNLTKLQQQLLDTAAAQRAQNAEAPVSGTRYRLPLARRTVEIVYYKSERLYGKKSPLIIGLHGGGALMGGGALNDSMWHHVSEALNTDVASVDYRLTPEHHFPDPVMDAYDASEYLINHALKFGFDRSRIYIMGFSSGGNIAAAASLLASMWKKKLFSFQILVYPYLDMKTPPGAKGASSDEIEIFNLFNSLYISPDQASDPLASPLYAGDSVLKGLPDTILITAGRDSLRHEGTAYAARLRQAGVRVYEAEYQNMLHAYFEHSFKTAHELVYCTREEIRLLENGSLAGAREETLKFIKNCL